MTLLLFGHTLFMGDVSSALLWGQDWLLLPPRHPPFANWLLNIFFQSRGIIRSNHHKPSFSGALPVYGLFIRTALC